ncbi:MAG: SAM-dependent methyltransferase, partial [Bacteroidales bacterium]|nr:SAM-dependent methyltransferase [Bacteroidales bacterium]
MQKLLEFVTEHLSDDTARLILDRNKWPDIDMQTAVNCIDSRRKLKGKVQEWYDEPGLVFPFKLSAEQCSSSATACYKASLAERIAGKTSWSIADLTGGLGVDSWFFSGKASKVLYNEMQAPLCDAAAHNFEVLGADNISISNRTAEKGHLDKILDGFLPDIIYMDPARR